jgi:molybdenum cofactor cytidylyltransferase
VVLAAGASRRLGQPKQFIRVAGESLLRRSARMAVEAGCAPVFVVLGYEAERMRRELDGLPVQVVVNPAWEEGMGSSLRVGTAAAMSADPLLAGVMVLVCDQPRLAVEHLKALIEQQDKGLRDITASAYAGRAGVPAVFGRGVLAELLAAEGDRGARDVIRRVPSRVASIDWPEGEIDVDRPDQLTSLEDGSIA